MIAYKRVDNHLVKTYRFGIIEFDNYDGDSFNLMLDLGFEIPHPRAVRLNGVDTPELRGGNATSKTFAKLARDKAHQFIANAIADCGAEFVSELYRGKYGRPLGDIVALGENLLPAKSLRDYLLENRLGVPYEGGSKAHLAPLHQANFEHLMEHGADVNL